MEEKKMSAKARLLRLRHKGKALVLKTKKTEKKEGEKMMDCCGHC